MVVHKVPLHRDDYQLQYKPFFRQPPDIPAGLLLLKSAPVINRVLLTRYKNHIFKFLHSFVNTFIGRFTMLSGHEALLESYHRLTNGAK